MISPFCVLFILSLSFSISFGEEKGEICIIGSGISGSAVAFFLRTYSHDYYPSIRIFERNSVVGGRIKTVLVSGDQFEAGASIIHPKNYHMLNFSKILKLEPRYGYDGEENFGIWNGEKFLFKSLKSRYPFFDKIVSFLDAIRMFGRYGISLIKMRSFTEKTLNNFSHFYKNLESRPIFGTVEEMLQWAGIYELTQKTLQNELIDAGLSPKLISEIITVIMRINYGQSTNISGLAGAVSLAGSGSKLWSVKGGNWQIPAGLIRLSNVSLHFHEEIISISRIGNYYQLNSTAGNSYKCRVTVIATPLNEVNINFFPPIAIPNRKIQHTHVTFVRGNLNPAYFGLNSMSEIPDTIGTIEAPGIPFSSISVLKKYDEKDRVYKIFSRAPMEDTLLDLIFCTRNDSVRINWAAYPHYQAPEIFAPFLLDNLHLYYINAFETAASAMETGAVAAENVARLILSRISASSSISPHLRSDTSDKSRVHLEL